MADGDDRFIKTLEKQIEDLKKDNAKYREQRREATKTLADKDAEIAGLQKKVLPEGHVAVVKAEWEKVKGVADKVETLKLGDLDTLATRLSEGTEAVVGVSVEKAAKAASLSESSTKLLRALVRDGKLPAPAIKTVKVDDKDVATVVVTVDGKEVALRDHVKATPTLADYESALFATAEGAPPEKQSTSRMPAQRPAARTADRKTSADAKDSDKALTRVLGGFGNAPKPPERAASA
jgi:hypothetical protein